MEEGDQQGSHTMAKVMNGAGPWRLEGKGEWVMGVT